MKYEMRETFSDGSERVVAAAKFRNPTDRTVLFDLEREEAVIGRLIMAENRHDGSKDLRKLKYKVEPGAEVLVPLDCANAVATPRCDHPACRTHRLYCRNTAHRNQWTIVAGLAPMMERVFDDGDEIAAPKLHPALELRAEERPLPANYYASVHERTLARLAARAGVK